MKKNEAQIQAELMLLLGALPDVRLFRNTVGQAWQGKIISHCNSEIALRHPRRTSYGLHPGSSDLIGWRSVVVTPEMVGRSVAVIVSAEIKSPHGVLSADQANWIDQVRLAGGVACVLRGAADAHLVDGCEIGIQR